MKSQGFTDRLYSIETTKSFGLPNGLGFITCGVSPLGEDNEMAGIYQRRTASKVQLDPMNAVLGTINLGFNKLGSYQTKKLDSQYNHKIIIRMRHYVPTNPQTEPQQAGRTYFATLVSAWQALTQSEKDIWNKKNFPVHMSGYNRFLSYHLNAHDL